MKRKSIDFYVCEQEFPSVRLYKGDLEEYISFAAANGLKSYISDSDYEYDSLDEVRTNRGSYVPSISLRFAENSSRQSVRLRIRKNGISLSADNKQNLIAAWQQIRQALDKRIPWFARYLKTDNWFGGGFLWLILVAILAGQLPKPLQNTEAVTWAILGVPCFSGGMAVVSWIYPRLNHGVYLQREHEALTFWRRYGEKIGLLALGTALGIASKIITDHFSK